MVTWWDLLIQGMLGLIPGRARPKGERREARQLRRADRIMAGAVVLVAIGVVAVVAVIVALIVSFVG